MSKGWLEINDPNIDAREVERRVAERMSRRGLKAGTEGQEDAARVAHVLWRERFGEAVSTGDLAGNAPTEWIAVWLRDCDVVPRNYRIDWRLPILGPIHAWIRRIINREVRRYLVPALEKQSFLNRKTLETLDTLLKRQKALSRTNEHLRQEIERLRERLDRDQDAR